MNWLPWAIAVTAVLILAARAWRRAWRRAGRLVADAERLRPADYPPSRPPGHPKRQLRKRIDVLTCGCTLIYDGHDREWNVIACGRTAVDWDAELRRLTP